MFVACWSSKGGSGTTVVATSLALLAARTRSTVLVDLSGDCPAVLGLSDPDLGVQDWLAAGPQSPPDRLASLEIDTPGNLRLLPRGRASGGAPAPLARLAGLADALASDDRAVVVDCGLLDCAAAVTVAEAATTGFLVLRPCYLALRRALALPITATAAILVTDPSRVLRTADVSEVLGVPVWAEVALDPAVARAVDAGILASRMPRGLERSLARAA
ncbi:MAG: hypothetical protein ACT4OS_03780 [Acidimicrobiales bacterium]